MQTADQQVVKEKTGNSCKIQIQYESDSSTMIMSVSGLYKACENPLSMILCKDEMQEKNCQRLLVDFRGSDYRTSITTAYNLSKEAEKALVPRRNRYVFLFDELKEEHLFTETVFINRGWSFRVFNDFDEGMSWLKKDV